MLGLIFKYPYIAIAIAAVVAILSYGAYKKWEGGHEVKKDVEIKALKDTTKQNRKDIATREKQNEILGSDITPAEFSGILLRGEF